MNNFWDSVAAKQQRSGQRPFPTQQATLDPPGPLFSGLWGALGTVRQSPRRIPQLSLIPPTIVKQVPALSTAPFLVKVPVRVVRSLWPTGQGWAGGMSAKEVCVSKMGLSFLSLHSKFLFPRGNSCWLWVGGGFGRGGGFGPFLVPRPHNTQRQECIGRGGGTPPPPPLQGAQPMPSHCLPDGKCQPQWHL